MIERLLKEAAAEASHKAWCDEEFAESKEEKAKLAKLQAEMDKMRAEEHDAFMLAEADLPQGLEGVRQALKVLRDYYAQEAEGAALMQQDVTAMMQQPAKPEGHSKATGAASGIIGMLEVAESDFARNLAEARQAEETAQEQYDKTTQENKVTKATKEQDVKYKTKEATSLKKFVAEASTDLSGAQTELDAILEYIEKLKEQCIAKPEPYEERKRRREAEIEGLKEALSILEGEAVFLQMGTRAASLRGVKTHHA